MAHHLSQGHHNDFYSDATKTAILNQMVVVHVFNLISALGRQRQGGSEFQASQGYIVLTLFQPIKPGSLRLSQIRMVRLCFLEKETIYQVFCFSETEAASVALAGLELGTHQ